MSLELSVRQLNEMIEKKQIVDAFQKFYGEDVVMVEAGGEPMIGKPANLERERAFEAGLTLWDAKLVSSAIDEKNGTALNEWILTWNHSGWGAATARQVAVQRWRDGQIVHEAFYKL
jgi:hypothetical protein